MPKNVSIPIESALVTCDPAIDKATCKFTSIVPKNKDVIFTGVNLIDINQSTATNARYSGLGFSAVIKNATCLITHESKDTTQIRCKKLPVP